MTGDHNGGVIWICGLAGVGKTTLATELTRLLRQTHASVALIDGDDFRNTQMPDAGYGRSDRLLVARAISGQAWENARQGSLCVVATISLFTEIHDGNRACEQTYRLPLVLSCLSAPAALLRTRRASLMHAATDVMGRHISAEMPCAPDHTFVNEGRIELLHAEALTLCQLWSARRQRLLRTTR